MPPVSAPEAPAGLRAQRDYGLCSGRPTRFCPSLPSPGRHGAGPNCWRIGPTPWNQIDDVASARDRRRGRTGNRVVTLNPRTSPNFTLSEPPRPRSSDATARQAGRRASAVPRDRPDGRPRGHCIVAILLAQLGELGFALDETVIAGPRLRRRLKHQRTLHCPRGGFSLAAAALGRAGRRPRIVSA